MHQAEARQDHNAILNSVDLPPRADQRRMIASLQTHSVVEEAVVEVVEEEEEEAEAVA